MLRTSMFKYIPCPSTKTQIRPHFKLACRRCCRRLQPLELSGSHSLLISGSGSRPQRPHSLASHAFAAAENIKNLPLALRSRDKLWASRGYPSLPELRHAFLPHKRWEDCETIAAWLSQSPVPCLPPHPLTSLRASWRSFDTRLKRGRENSRLHLDYLDLSPSALSISLLSP